MRPSPSERIIPNFSARAISDGSSRPLHRSIISSASRISGSSSSNGARKVREKSSTSRLEPPAPSSRRRIASRLNPSA